MFVLRKEEITVSRDFLVLKRNNVKKIRFFIQDAH